MNFLLMNIQLLLSDRILGMTLVPEGKVWNYGAGLATSWMPNISFSMTLDTPLSFWAEPHRPSYFLSVRNNFGASNKKINSHPSILVCKHGDW